ncbi:MAG: hypothetical protein ACRETL_02490 [Gammaproteobacteria bacterium]
MKPPFWEVTISRREIAGEEPTIESVNCFADPIAAEEYADRALHEDATLRIVVRHVDGMAAVSGSSRWINGSRGSISATTVTGRHSSD